MASRPGKTPQRLNLRKYVNDAINTVIVKVTGPRNKNLFGPYVVIGSMFYHKIQSVSQGHHRLSNDDFVLSVSRPTTLSEVRIRAIFGGDFRFHGHRDILIQSTTWSTISIKSRVILGRVNITEYIEVFQWKPVHE